MKIDGMKNQPCFGGKQRPPVEVRGAEYLVRTLRVEHHAGLKTRRVINDRVFVLASSNLSLTLCLGGMSDQASVKNGNFHWHFAVRQRARCMEMRMLCFL